MSKVRTRKTTPKKSFFARVPVWAYFASAFILIAAALAIIFTTMKMSAKEVAVVIDTTTDSLTLSNDQIEGAIIQTAIDFGVPKKAILTRLVLDKELGYKITETTVKIHKNFPVYLISAKFQQAVADSSGKVLDVFDKKGGAEIFMSFSLNDSVSHKLKIKRLADAPLETAYVALLIDHFGMYEKETVKKYLSFDIAFSASILPNEPRTPIVLEEFAKKPDVEKLVHVPMEPKTYPQVDPGVDAILTTLDDREVKRRMEKMIAAIPGAVGANNRMGSRATESSRVMFQVLRALRDAGYFWIDSRTTPMSIAEKLASDMKVPATHIDHIIDPPELSNAEIEMRIFDYCLNARRMPSMIINCRASDTTAAVLEKAIPVLETYGVKFITVSKALELREQWKSNPK